MNTKLEPPTGHEGSLDPADWADYRRQAHALLDTCIDHLVQARDRAVWQPPASAPHIEGEALPWDGARLDEVIGAFERLILPYPTGNTHPRFFGWVHGTGTPNGMLAEMCAAAMNSNCGGRDHVANYVERTVIDWCRQVFGLPAGASGILTVGTSEATLLALCTALVWKTEGRSRSEGLGAEPRFTAYASQEAHNAIGKTFEVMGLGKAALRRVPVDRNFAMDIDALDAAIEEDRAAGFVPFCVIGTAGSVNCGAFDDLEAIAETCEKHGVWFHVDGAFGIWAAIADEPWRSGVRGVERADSVAFDFHKWMYVQYDCGCVLVRDETAHRAAFAARPDYLGGASRGIAGGERWFCDYGIDLSRGFRALKVWFALKEFGFSRLGDSITANCRQAHRMAEHVCDAPDLELLAPVALNVCCFRYRHGDMDPARLDRLNEAIAITLQEEGSVVLSTTRVDGKLALRAAITNHRTQMSDVDMTIRLVLDAGKKLAAGPLSSAEKP